jgi:outer membrane immunogenic protein
MLRIAAGAVLALLFLGSAFAQTPTYDWTGFYIGANGGYGWATDDTVNFTYSGIGGCPGVGCPASVSIDTEGFLAGGHAGANWQHNMWVLGIEGDADWSDINGSGTVASGTSTLKASSELDWLSTLRGRIGVGANRALFYGTGGVAFGEVNNRASLTVVPVGVFAAAPPSATFSGKRDDVQFGWTAGAGIEFAATDRVVLGAEALFVDLDDTTVNLGPLGAGQSISAHFDNDFVVARGRVSFKW